MSSFLSSKKLSDELNISPIKKVVSFEFQENPESPSRNDSPKKCRQSQLQSLNLKKADSINNNIKKQDDYYLKNLIHGQNITHAQFKQFLIKCQDDINYASHHLKAPPLEYIQKKMVSLPHLKDPKQKILFLNLDNTIICRCGKEEKDSHQINFKNCKGEEVSIYIKIRPHLFEFLKTISQQWDIYVFSSSTKPYATHVVKFLDPKKKYIKGVFHREHCMQTNQGFFIKDLRIIKDKDLSQMTILDNTVHSFAFQIDNGIPIIDWLGDSTDVELLYVLSYMNSLVGSSDVRKINQERFKLAELENKHLYELKM